MKTPGQAGGASARYRAQGFKVTATSHGQERHPSKPWRGAPWLAAFHEAAAEAARAEYAANPFG